MTYISNWIESTGGSLAQEPMSKIFAKDLPEPLDRFGPYELAGWAKSKGLEVDYVDNCWVRVAVAGPDLIAFLFEHYGADHPFVLKNRPRIKDGVSYIIVAEEF